jgi:hypothetical protein
MSNNCFITLKELVAGLAAVAEKDVAEMPIETVQKLAGMSEFPAGMGGGFLALLSAAAQKRLATQPAIHPDPPLPNPPGLVAT